MFPQVAGSIEIRYGAGTKTRPPNIVDLPEIAPIFTTTGARQKRNGVFRQLQSRWLAGLGVAMGAKLGVFALIAIENCGD